MASALSRGDNLRVTCHTCRERAEGLDQLLDFRGDQLFLSDRPGLGVDFDVELLKAKSVYRRPG